MQQPIMAIWKNSVWLKENYEILQEEPIGKWSYAEVYLVKEKSDQKEYALRVQIMDDQNDQFKDAINEIHSMMKLDHPNIIKYDKK